MRVVLISNSEWDNNNSFGNTFSNFLKSNKEIEFLNIYCRSGNPHTNLCTKFIRFSDKDVCKHIFNKKMNPFLYFENPLISKCVSNQIQKKKIKRLPILCLIRELMWFLSHIITKNFYKVMDNFKPDVILAPTYPFRYINKIVWCLHKRYKAPIISYISDDDYSFRQFSLLPSFWINRIISHFAVKKTLSLSSKVFAISEIQRKELKRDFNIESELLTKFYDFQNKKVEEKNLTRTPYKMLYAGNIDSGRKRTIKIICKTLRKINKTNVFFTLDIYSPQHNDKSLKKLGCSYIKVLNPISYEMLLKKYIDYPIVIHAEGLRFSDALKVHQSFSTKIIDMMYYEKCIFAVGNIYAASISYLKENDAALVANKRKEIPLLFDKIIQDKKLLAKYSANSFMLGVKNHDKSIMDNKMINSLLLLGGDCK